MDPYKYRPNSEYNSTHWTTNTGMPVWNNNNSMTVGVRGPVLLEDYHLVEKLSNFDRERIPERVVHARGAVAKGFFEVTHDISHLTCADFLRAPGVQTPIIARFSTVVHERGSPETLRDPRGFAVKFYTREGNFDMVGNNFPVFFVRDSIKFPDMVHALKPNPKTNIQEPWRFADFFSHHPEAMHMFTFLMDDEGVPKDYRHMIGSGVHTFKLLNGDGRETLIKWHWRPSCGVANLATPEEIAEVQGANHQHATADLWDAVASGDYPEWGLFIQTMDPADEDKFEFDPLDVTKVWPEDRFPLQPVGRMVLNKNPDNFFAENEMLAFNPGLIVPGIAYSDDKLLQGRIYSYSDTQRYRLGGNYLLLPVNAPKCAHHNNHFDGVMNFMQRTEDVNYFPSRYDPARNSEKYPVVTAPLAGRRERAVIPKENNFQQPGERFRTFDPARQERFITRISEMLLDDGCNAEIRRVWVGYLTQCDADLGKRVAQKLTAKSAL
ncbi:Catalase isozyme 2 [Auxenochlorella protothecoides]|uniref:catalase n=3 Tax=Auxenochlorella protothecoides TaxID=3075 RepID=A0A087SDZ8_AUXPR|nr:Catalase isozyme 2 [Auxenochlorella protothecoides]KFM23952.1 Catalase isozyme 2 [Auxenochlorella protothecoides]